MKIKDMDRVQLIYSILQEKLGNYRTAKGAKLLASISSFNDEELKNELRKVRRYKIMRRGGYFPKP